MNTINILVHQWIITQHPHLVEICEKFDDRDVFEPIKLTCAVYNDVLTSNEFTYVKINAIVTYCTRYIETNGKQALLLIGLGNSVSVNIFCRLPTFCSWEIFLDVTKNRAISGTFNVRFPILFQSIYSGLPKIIKFKSIGSCWPQNNNPGTDLWLLSNQSTSLKNSGTSQPITQIKGKSWLYNP